MRQGYTHVHGVAAGRDLAGVTLSKSPVERVGEAVLPQVGDSPVLDLEGREVGYRMDVLDHKGLNHSLRRDRETYGTR